MLEVILDTETTGLSTIEKHRIVEIGCIELENQIPTNKTFQEYINPQRAVSENAYKNFSFHVFDHSITIFGLSFAFEQQGKSEKWLNFGKIKVRNNV